MPKPKERYKAIKEKLRLEAEEQTLKDEEKKRIGNTPLTYKVYDVIKLDTLNYAVVQLVHNGDDRALVNVVKDGLSSTRAYIERDNLSVQENIKRMKEGQV